MALIRTLLATAAVVVPLSFSTWAPPAGAQPRCLFQGDWDCQGTPQYNGPIVNTWDVPGTYGGWTTLPLLCPPGAGLQPCQQYVPEDP
jgi:hypothetical protein